MRQVYPSILTEGRTVAVVGDVYRFLATGEEITVKMGLKKLPLEMMLMECGEA